MEFLKLWLRSTLELLGQATAIIVGLVGFFAFWWWLYGSSVLAFVAGMFMFGGLLLMLEDEAF